jgi:hypothetical protein
MAKVLESVKTFLGLHPTAETAFDDELLLAINSAFSTLNQVGVGPEDPLVADSDTEWSEFLEDRNDLEQAKTYVCLNVKTIFDPPASGTIQEAQSRISQEMLWRLNRVVEGGVTNDNE